MDLEGQRRSQNVEYRTGGPGRGGFGGGMPLRLRGMSIGGIVIIGILALGLQFCAPPALRDQVLSQILGGQSAGPTADPATASAACPTGQEQSCQFFETVLASTEDVWGALFQQGALPRYGAAPPSAYQQPRLVVFFADSVATGCGAAGADVGPFYCPADRQLYINPAFYETMARRLNAPGDFAQAYVIAHEVAHHVQNLIGATTRVEQARGTREQNQMSVRLELQADCLAGVWGRAAQANLSIGDADLREALNAAHAIGDDTLQRNSRGYPDPATFTHGTSDQRVRWFRRGFEGGDARQCDTFGAREL